MSEFADILKEKLWKKQKQVKVIGQISDLNYGCLNINCLDGRHLEINIPIENVKIRFQTLTSGALFTQGNYRLDNCHHLPVHQHQGLYASLVEVKTLGDAFLHILGSEAIVIDPQLKLK